MTRVILQLVISQPLSQCEFWFGRMFLLSPRGPFSIFFFFILPPASLSSANKGLLQSNLMILSCFWPFQICKHNLIPQRFNPWTCILPTNWLKPLHSNPAPWCFGWISLSESTVPLRCRLNLRIFPNSTGYMLPSFDFPLGIWGIFFKLLEINQ